MDFLSMANHLGIYEENARNETGFKKSGSDDALTDNTKK